MKKLLYILGALLLPLSASAVQISVPSAPGYGYMLVGSATGNYTTTATSSLGLPTFSYPFPLQLGGGNATSSLTGFSGGILSTASSTFTKNTQFGDFIALSATSTPTAPASGTLQIYGLQTNGITRPAYQDGCPELVLGRDSVYVAKNTTAGSIAQTSIVDVTGSTGNVPNIAKQIAPTGATGMMADGVVFGGIGSTAIGINNFGCVMKLGIISGIDTHLFASDDMLYLSTTTAGAVVNYQPVWPDVSQMVGVVLTSGIGNGSIFYHLTSGTHNTDTGTVQNSFGIGGFGGGTRTLLFGNGATSTLTVNPTLNTFNFSGLSSGVVGSNGGTLYAVASSSLFGFTPVSPTRAINTTWPIIGGGDLSADRTLTFGWATTSQPASSNLYVSNGTNGFYGVATSTLTASSPLTGSFTQIGSGGSIGCTTASSGVAGCLSNTAFDTFNNKQNAGFQISTTSSIGISKLAYFTGITPTILGGVATSSETCSTGIACASHDVLTGGGAITLATINAGVLGAQTNATVPTSQATSTLYGTSSGGMVLGWNNTTGGIAWVATSTGGGSSFAYPFQNLSEYATSTAATTTMPWFQEGLYASTTNSVMQGLTIDSGTSQDAWTTAGSANHEWSYGAKLSDFTFRISSSTTLGTSDALTIDKNLLVTVPTSFKVASLAGLGAWNSGLAYAISTSSPVNMSISGNAATVTTNANLTGDVTSVGNATSYANTVPINKGGTATTTATTNGVVYADGSKLTEDPAKLSFGGVFFGISSSTPNFSLSVGTGNSAFYVSTSTGKIVGYDSTNGWNGRISPTHSFVLSTATTTTWTGTTTGAYVPQLVMPFAGTLQQVRCSATSTAAFLGIAPFIGTTATTPNYLVASSTIGKVPFTANNTFSAGNVISMYVGTSTASTANLGVACTFDITETP